MWCIEVTVTGKTRFGICLLVALSLCFISATPQVRVSPPPKVLHLKGRFLYFSSVDYVNAAFCVGDSMRFFWLDDPAPGFFCAAHPGAMLNLEVRVMSEDSLSTDPEYGLIAVSLNGYRSDVWWSEAVRVLGSTQAFDLFSQLEDQMTLSPGGNVTLPTPRCGSRSGEPSLGLATGVVAGRVTDESYDVPQQYCSVILWDMVSGTVRFRVVTGMDGKYLMPNVPVGTYAVLCKMLGFVDGTRNRVRVSEHDTTIVDFKLQPKSPRHKG